MSTIGPTYPAHTIVSQAEVRLVADQTTNADTKHEPVSDIDIVVGG